MVTKTKNSTIDHENSKHGKTEISLLGFMRKVRGEGRRVGKTKKQKEGITKTRKILAGKMS